MSEYKTTTQDWQSRYQQAVNNQEKMFRRFSKWYDLMYAAINTKDYAPWRSKVYLPILASKAWAMIAKLQALNPGFEVGLYGDDAEKEGAQEMADKAQWKIEHDWNNPMFDESITDKLFSPLTDALVCGTGLAKVPWCKEKKDFYSRPELVDGYVDPTKEKVDTKDVGYNDLIPVNIFNVFVAPGATNLYSANWLIIKEFKTWQELSDSGMYDKDKLNIVKDMQAKTDQFAQEKKSRNRLTTDQDPIASDDTVKQIEIYECYEKSSNNICTFAVGGTEKGKSNWIELRSQKNPYWHGKYPLVVFYTRKRPFDFWGQGIFEDTEKMQMAAIDVFNHFVDSYNLSVNGMIMKPEGETFKYTVGPGQELKYRSQKPEQFKFADPNPAIMQQVMNTIESSIESATISAYAEGTPDSATDKTQGTATGIRKLQNAAGDKIGFFKDNYRTALRMVGTMWLSNNRQFVSKPTIVDGMVENRPAPVKVTPSDLQGQMVLRINDASMEPEGKEQKLQGTLAYIQQLEGLRQSSIQQAQTTGGITKPLIIDYGVLSEELSEDFGKNNYDKLILSEDELAKRTEEAQVKAQEAQAQQGEAEDQQQQPEPPKPPSVSVSYKDLPPDAKAQVEAEAGLQPSAIHATEMKALELAQQQMMAPIEHANGQVAQDAQMMAEQGHIDPQVLNQIGVQNGQGTEQPEQAGGIGQPDGASSQGGLMELLRRATGR